MKFWQAEFGDDKPTESMRSTLLPERQMDKRCPERVP